MRYLVTVADVESEEEYVVEVEAPGALAAVVLVSGPYRRARSVVPESFVAGEARPGAGHHERAPSPCCPRRARARAREEVSGDLLRRPTDRPG